MRTKFSGNAFNIAVAAFAAASVAFAVFAMPADLFGRLVGMTGLPALLPAAEPPLGATARLAAIALAAAVCFLAVWLLLRAFDPRPAKPADEAADGDELSESDWIAPRLRRADAHPDAPARRPLFAGKDLGEPGEADAGETVSTAPEEPAILLRNVVQLPTGLLPPPEPTADDAPEAREQSGSAGEAAANEDAKVSSILDLGEPIEDEGITTEALIARLPLPEARGESVSSLLQRLDEGLAACEWPLPPGDGAAPASGDESESASGGGVEDPSSDEAGRAPGEDRLRSVLDDLQKMAARSA